MTICVQASVQPFLSGGNIETTQCLVFLSAAQPYLSPVISSLAITIDIPMELSGVPGDSPEPGRYIVVGRVP